MQTFPCESKLKRGLAFTSHSHGLSAPLSRDPWFLQIRWCFYHLTTASPLPRTAECPEPLCLPWVLPMTGCSCKHLRGRYSPFIAHPGSCARPNPSQRLEFPLGSWVFAGCRQSLLGDGPSQHYLCNPCEVAWTHTPPRLLDAFTHFFSKNFGLTKRERSSARGDIPAMQQRQGRSFEAAVIRLPSGFFTC